MRDRILEVGGHKQTLSQWAGKLGLDPNTVHQRLYIGWTVEQALGLAPNPGAVKKQLNAEKAELARKQRATAREHEVRGVRGTPTALARHFGVNVARLYYHLKAGRTAEEAIARLLNDEPQESIEAEVESMVREIIHQLTLQTY